MLVLVLVLSLSLSLSLLLMLMLLLLLRLLLLLLLRLLLLLLLLLFFSLVNGRTACRNVGDEAFDHCAVSLGVHCRRFPERCQSAWAASVLWVPTVLVCVLAVRHHLESPIGNA